MISIKLIGGIGNQMFQYASAKSLSLTLNCPLILDIHEFEKYPDRKYDLHVFSNIKETFCSKSQHKTVYSKSFAAKVKRKFSGLTIYNEPHFHVDSNFFNLQTNSFLFGYFHSEQYFQIHQDKIRALFKWDKDKLSDTTLGYLNQIKAHNAISIHFRRGDYVKNTKTNEFHGTCSQDYYIEAIKLMLDKYPDSHFFIFSDDISWVMRQGLFIDTQHTYIKKSEDMHDSEEMFLMSQCKHNITANSSFSWWGAWLNNFSEKTVISPTPWFRTNELDTKDLIPESWIKI